MIGLDDMILCRPPRYFEVVLAREDGTDEEQYDADHPGDDESEDDEDGEREGVKGKLVRILGLEPLKLCFEKILCKRLGFEVFFLVVLLGVAIGL
ncbi:hypothetical protein PanWU01x14_286270 [Parasponia andersonii]|uniref:Uncharacterized protein n=1 Tax=Parasponia andersonii TaxID=3476 RepID=A0A2P5AZE2_PARAD|nr:hypothetical protein PanWU01x14_286270 [Parasponia andersonii]